MFDYASIVSSLNLLGLGGLAAFIVWTIKGLKQRIAALTELAKEQTKTLETVRSRAQEFEKLSQGYKQALLDFQEMGQKLEEKRGELVKELEHANEQKDKELVRMKELQLEEITLKKRSLEKVSQLETSLGTAVSELQKQLEILAPVSSPQEASDRNSLLQLHLLEYISSRIPTKGQNIRFSLLTDHIDRNSEFINWKYRTRNHGDEKGNNNEGKSRDNKDQQPPECDNK